MQRLSQAIKAVFSDFDESQFNEKLEMGQIPGWDSMNSVNLQLQIELAFNVKFGDFSLNDEHRVSDVINFLQTKGIKINN